LSKRSNLVSRALAALALFTAFALSGVASAQVSVTATVGTLGPTAYTTLKGAFDAVNLGTHRGAIAISITADSTESSSAVLNASGSGSSLYTAISIKPSGGAFRLIFGTMPNGSPLIDLNGADNVTIDGLNAGGNSLALANLNGSAVAGTSTIRFINGASNNTVTNTSLHSLFSGGVTVGGGTVVFGTDSLTANGNDNNTIANNTFANIFGASSTTGIHMLGSTSTPAINNSGNVITGNNFEDIFGAAVSSSSVYIGAGNTDATISNNKFYQTASRTKTTGEHTAVWINNPAGNNFHVSGNIIGFASSVGTGVYSLVTSSSAEFAPIALNVGTTVATSVQNNTIAGIAVSGNSTFQQFRAIYVVGGSTLIGTITGNTIGSQFSTGSISQSSNTTGVSILYAISDEGNGDSDIRNNQIGGITANNSSTGAMQITAIDVAKFSAGSSTVQNNVIGGAIVNSIQSNSTATGSQMVGVSIRSANATVIGNTIRSMTAAGGTGTNTAASVIGVAISASGSNHTVSQNSIFNLVNTNTTDDTIVTGIQFTGSTGTNLVERNFIYGLRSLSASVNAEINGIRVSGGTTTYRNNMINVGTEVWDSMGSGSSTGGINGFNEVGGTNQFFHNSVYVGGPAKSGSGPSAAFTTSTGSATRSIRNNIFQNARSNSFTATGKNYAVRYGGSGTINNNLYLANGWGGVFGNSGGVDVPSLAAWKDAVGQDASSISADPKYVNPTGFTPDMHLQAATFTAAEGNGVDLGVLDDFDGQVRASLTPHDIGADAGNFVGGDVLPPVISYALLSAGVVGTNRVLSVNITDVTAVATGALAPRIYFGKNLGAYVSTPCTLASGTVQNGSWNCTIDHALLSGVVVADTIKYFVVAQDTVTNLDAKPGAGFVGSNVNTVNSPPSAPSQYVIAQAVSGSYSAGPGQSFTSLTKAGAGGLFAAINAGVITGNVTINITGDLLIEDGAVALNQWNEAGAGNYSLLIKPSGAARTISGSSAVSLIRLIDVDRLTIDGSLTGGTATGIGGDAALRQLTVTNTNVGTYASVLYVDGGVNGAQNNTFKNLKIVGQSPLTSLYGIVLGTDSQGIGKLHDNNRIENCSVQKVRVGIGVYGRSAAYPSTGTVILRNDLSATGANRVQEEGISVFSDDGAQISENSIGGMDNNGSYGGTGINLGFAPSETVINANVSRNKISGVTASGTYSAVGIWVGGGVGTNILSNNMITGVTSNATLGGYVAGVRIDGVAGSSTKLFHNSIAMTGSRIAAAGQVPSFAVAIAGIDPTVELKNNIFYTTQDGSAGGANAKSYAIGMQTTTFTNLNSNYNTFYTAGLTPGFFRRGSLAPAAGSDYDKIALWRVDTGQDANSLTVDPIFVNPVTDLHLQATSPMLGAGTPIAGVTIDFDGQARDTPPDIGADEIPTTTPPTVTTNPLTQSVNVGSTATFTAAATGSPTPTVQWFVSSDSGATFTAILGATATTLSFTVALADHNKRYRATFTNSSNSADSAAATLTVLVPVNVNVPAGIQFSRDATVFTGSQTLNVAQLSNFTLSTTSPQNVAAGSRDAFVSWSDTGAISHTVTVNGPTTITASFVKQHQLTVSAGAGGSVTPASGTFYNTGSVEPVTATANAGFGFVNWTGSGSGSLANANAASTTVTMSAPQTIAANFVATAPVTITQNPLNLAVVVGNMASFTAAATGSPTPTVQWSRSNDGGANYAPIPGATAATYSFTPVIADGGSLYRATFGNGFTSATTTTAVLTVSYGPILNIDNSDAATKYDPATDGVLLLRYLFGLRGSALIANARGAGAGLRDAAAIEAHLAANLSLLDVDGDAQTLPLTDGLMILRRLLNPTALATDAAASAAITAGAKRGVLSDEAVVKAIDALKP
jgi:hypothetical protein